MPNSYVTRVGTDSVRRHVSSSDRLGGVINWIKQFPRTLAESESYSLPFDIDGIILSFGDIDDASHITPYLDHACCKEPLI